jgi:gallate decarboxylase subunit D
MPVPKGFLMIELTETIGRLTIHLRAERIGADWSVAIFGGDRPHIGAVALAGSDGRCQAICLLGHREGGITERFAANLASRLGAAVCVSCGIHLDAITQTEIESVTIALENIFSALEKMLL